MNATKLRKLVIGGAFALAALGATPFANAGNGKHPDGRASIIAVRHPQIIGVLKHPDIIGVLKHPDRFLKCGRPAATAAAPAGSRPETGPWPWPGTRSQTTRVRTSPWLREILTLDPERDAPRIVHIDTVYEFPFDTTRSLELALFRTFASPKVSRLLDETKEFAYRAQRRYDDTDLILSTIVESGYDSDEGKRAIRRMNRLHRRFDIAERGVPLRPVDVRVRADSLERALRLAPVRRAGAARMVPLLARGRHGGWRSRTSRRPPRSSSATTSSTSARSFRSAETNARVARASRDMFVAWFPGVPKSVGAYGISALMDEPLRDALGFPRPPRALVHAVDAALKTRARVVRTLPPRRKPKLRTQLTPPHVSERLRDRGARAYAARRGLSRRAEHGLAAASERRRPHRGEVVESALSMRAVSRRLGRKQPRPGLRRSRADRP